MGMRDEATDPAARLAAYGAARTPRTPAQIAALVGLEAGRVAALDAPDAPNPVTAGTATPGWRLTAASCPAGRSSPSPPRSAPPPRGRC